MKFNKENIKALFTKERLIGIGIGAFVAALFAGSCWYAWYCGNQAYMENGGVAEPISTVTSTDVSADIDEAVETEAAEVEAEIKAHEEAEAKAAAEAEAAAAAAAAAQNYTNYNTTYSGSSSYGSSSWDGGSAKDFIIYHESRGDYTATNGKYYGAYQLDINYLNGDLSPENQDRVAEEYVNNRYGGWEGAMAHWQSNGWY